MRRPSTFTSHQPTRSSLISLSGPRASTTFPLITCTATRKPTAAPTTRTTSTMRPMMPHFLTRDPAISASPRIRGADRGGHLGQVAPRGAAAHGLDAPPAPIVPGEHVHVQMEDVLP